jgi:hypothetical protein
MSLILFFRFWSFAIMYGKNKFRSRACLEKWFTRPLRNRQRSHRRCRCVKSFVVFCFAAFGVKLQVQALKLTQESVNIKFPTAVAADEFVAHVFECGALGGRCLDLFRDSL